MCLPYELKAPKLLGSIRLITSPKIEIRLTDTGNAIRIAQIYGLDQAEGSNAHMSDKEYPRWREVWGAMIFLDTSVRLRAHLPS
jgi:hypothetical protein